MGKWLSGNFYTSICIIIMILKYFCFWFGYLTMPTPDWWDKAFNDDTKADDPIVWQYVDRDSDSAIARKNMKIKARHALHCGSEKRMVNFVIFVVDGVSVQKSMTNEDSSQYTRLITESFNCPYLSFKGTISYCFHLIHQWVDMHLMFYKCSFCCFKYVLSHCLMTIFLFDFYIYGEDVLWYGQCLLSIWCFYRVLHNFLTWWIK